MSDNLHQLAGQISALFHQAIQAANVEVDDIIQSGARDTSRIEHQLDHMLDFCCDPDMLLAFKRLCRYFYDIDPVAIRLQDTSLRTYLKTVLESTAGRHLIDAVLNTTVQKTLNLKDIRKLPIPLPTNAEIKWISGVSEALTRRITLLRETNATLEAIAQALFKSWFVDFDPVRAKMAGRAPEGMDEATARLFPDSFEESELGLVPRGCLENGKSAFVDFLADGQIGWGSTEFLVLRPKAPLPEYFGYLLCRHPAFREYAVQSMSGTSGRQRIQNDVLGRYLLAVPCAEIAAVFTGVVESIQASIAANHATAQTLATLRDTLLPRLISGALRLPEAQAAAEEALA